MSNAQFDLIALTNDRYLVKGTDQFGTTNQAVLDGSEANALDAKAQHKDAHAEFDAALENFYAPLNKALDKLSDSHEDDLDPLTYVVEQEGSPAVAAMEEVITILDADTVVIRAIRLGLTDRLVWVGDKLEVLQRTGSEVRDEAAAPFEGTPFEGMEEAVASAVQGLFGDDVTVQTVSFGDIFNGNIPEDDSNHNVPVKDEPEVQDGDLNR